MAEEKDVNTEEGLGSRKISRRSFLRVAGALGGALAAGSVLCPVGKTIASSIEEFNGYPDRNGVLTDVGRCVGCRQCELACARANNLSVPDLLPRVATVYETTRRTTSTQYTVVNRYTSSQTGQTVYRKQQCMHCNEPACVTACPVAALKKTSEGAVIYDESLCMGCRYCLNACPFSMAAYSYESAFSPAVKKCTMCFQRFTEQGKQPACVEACPPHALTFGKRADLIKTAHGKIDRSRGQYIDRVYGENDAGGTSWMYISPLPFDMVGLPDLGTTPFPEYTRDFLIGVPVMYVIWPALLGGIYAISKQREKSVAKEVRARIAAEKSEHDDEEV